MGTHLTATPGRAASKLVCVMAMAGWAIGVMPGALAAQVRTPTPEERAPQPPRRLDAAEPERPGWIGVSVDIRTEGDARGSRTTAVVADVRPGSPAAAAGIRPGDALLEVNELRGPSDLGMLASQLQLHPGDPVRLVVRRGGTEREVRMVATERPSEMAPPLSHLVAPANPDSMVESIVRAMDSLRVRLAESPGVRVRVAPTAPAPPAALRSPGAPPGSTPMTDARPRPVPGAAAAWTVDSERTFRVWVFGDSAAAAGMPRPPRSPDAWIQGDVSSYSPLVPYVLGRNRVAGAEVIDLRPELARYFRVDGGVLVVDVPEATPAALAGLEPGDVIVEAAEAPISSVDDLRLRVSAVDDAVSVVIIRHGERASLTLHRR